MTNLWPCSSEACDPQGGSSLWSTPSPPCPRGRRGRLLVVGQPAGIDPGEARSRRGTRRYRPPGGGRRPVSPPRPGGSPGAHRHTRLVLPYRSATASGVLQVAFAFGRPVAATALGALAEDVEHGVTGLLVHAEDRDELATAMASLLREPDRARRMGVAAAEAAAHAIRLGADRRRHPRCPRRGGAMIGLVFWVAVALVAYTYAGYPLLDHLRRQVPARAGLSRLHPQGDADRRRLQRSRGDRRPAAAHRRSRLSERPSPGDRGRRWIRRRHRGDRPELPGSRGGASPGTSRGRWRRSNAPWNGPPAT